MRVKLLLFIFYLNGRLHAVSIRKLSERMSNFWMVRFLKRNPNGISVFCTSLFFANFHSVLGLLRFRLKFSGIHSPACFTILLPFMWCMCPNHLKCVCCMTVSIFYCPVCFFTFSSVTMSFHKILKILQCIAKRTNYWLRRPYWRATITVNHYIAEICRHVSESMVCLHSRLNSKDRRHDTEWNSNLKVHYSHSRSSKVTPMKSLHVTSY